MLKGIFKRTRQVFRALTARVSADDGKYISAHLNGAEQKLFFDMSLPDQSHCLRTAYTVERLVIPGKVGVDRELLIRCALLHDVGRRKGDLNTTGKIFAVLVESFAPKFADKLELRGNRAIYTYRHHPEIGARELQKIGLFREAKIVARHHSPASAEDSPELRLLRLADDEN